MSVLATPEIYVSNLEVPDFKNNTSGPGKSKTQAKMKKAMSILSLKGAGKNSERGLRRPSVTGLGQPSSTAGSHMHEGGLFDPYEEEKEEKPNQRQEIEQMPAFYKDRYRIKKQNGLFYWISSTPK